MSRFAERYGFILGYAGLAVLVVGASWYFITREMNPWIEGLLIGGVVLEALFVLARPAQVRAALTRRGIRSGSNAVVMSVAFIGILILLNYLAGRYHQRYDATELKEHTLSPQSVQVLAEIDESIAITGFFAADDYQREAFEKLLDQYLYHSDHLSYTVIDPDREPLRARQYEPSPYGGLLLQSGERTEVVYTPDEQDVTSALLKVVSEEKKVIYFLTGHQEHDPEGYGEDGYSGVASALRDQNYEVRALNLAITTTVPGDAAVVVVAGPQTALMDDELARLRSYLFNGGKALIMQDPLYDAGLDDRLLILLREDSVERGIREPGRLGRFAMGLFMVVVAANALQAFATTGPPPFMGQADPLRWLCSWVYTSSTTIFNTSPATGSVPPLKAMATSPSTTV